MRKARRGGKLPRRPLVRSLRFQTTDKPHKRKISAVQMESARIQLQISVIYVCVNSLICSLAS